MKHLTLPAGDGFYMPGEFSPQEGIAVIWPTRPGSWGRDPKVAQEAFLCVIRAAAHSGRVWLLAGKSDFEHAKEAAGNLAEVLEIESDDAWARDIAPTFVTNGHEVRGISWRFNAWGGQADGLYTDYKKDDALAAAVCRALGCSYYDSGAFVLEGGAVCSDGEGTLLVTESCLLSPGRNPSLRKDSIERTLKDYLGAEKVLWLPRGILDDETNEHVDNICVFTAPGEVVLAWTDDENNPQYALSKADYDYLATQTDAKGRRITVHKLPLPDYPVEVEKRDMMNFVFAPGEVERKPGERLAASYINFLFTNTAIIMPQFGGRNAASDDRAQRILSRVCRGRDIVPVDARAILLGGGNIHCITQQIPKGEFIWKP